MQNDSVNPQVLTELYSEYLNRSIQLTEENARLRVRIAELEAAQREPEQAAGVGDAG